MLLCSRLTITSGTERFRKIIITYRRQSTRGVGVLLHVNLRQTWRTGVVTATVFWDARGKIVFDYLQKRRKITAYETRVGLNPMVLCC